MASSIASVSLLVRDYDEAIRFFTDCLRFDLVEDTSLGNGKRWVIVSPPGGQGASILLAKAVGKSQESRIGDQTGGRVSIFLHTEDFRGDYEHMKACGVRFTEEPRQESYGMVAVFLDLYGNKWDLVQPS
jgi:catechol 2,3-dioxygenase-like lactoylglutathione lyase family enzyme